MDPAIVAILGNRRTRTNIVVEIQTPVVRRWCPFPGGLTVGGNLYTHVSMDVSGIEETADGSTGLSCELAILNVSQLASPLVLDSANRSAPVIIRRVWFDPTITPPAWAEDPDAAQIASEVWLDGRLGGCRFAGNRVIVPCQADLGRRGRVPAYKSADLMTSHKPPEPGLKLGWVRLEKVTER